MRDKTMAKPMRDKSTRGDQSLTRDRVNGIWLAWWLIAAIIAPRGVVAQPADTAGARAAIRTTITTYIANWNRADAAALAAAYVPSGDLIIPTGRVMNGPQEVASFYASAFAAGYRGSTGSATIDRIKFATPTVAVLDGTWSIVGAHDSQGNQQQPERGVYVAVMTRTPAGWRILALREQTSATELENSSSSKRAR